MIVLKISNASEVVASKLGSFLGSFAEGLDDSTIEDILFKKLIENLQAEGLKGEAAAVNGLELEAGQLVVQEGCQARRHQRF